MYLHVVDRNSHPIGVVKARVGLVTQAGKISRMTDKTIWVVGKSGYEQMYRRSDGPFPSSTKTCAGKGFIPKSEWDIVVANASKLITEMHTRCYSSKNDIDGRKILGLVHHISESDELRTDADARLKWISENFDLTPVALPKIAKWIDDNIIQTKEIAV